MEEREGKRGYVRMKVKESNSPRPWVSVIEAAVMRVK